MGNTTATLVKAACRIPVGVTFYDTRATSCAAAANKYVLGRLKQDSLAVLTETEYAEVFGPAQRSIVLNRRPIVAVSAVTVDDAALASTAYRIDSKYGILHRTDGSYWSYESDGTKVHYGAGYDSSTIPDDLVEAATLIAVALFNRGAVAGLESQDDGATDVTVSDEAIPATARAILSRYSDLM